MKEAVGTSFVFNLVIIFTSVFIVLYISSIAYSKGFKIRNRIIDIIEQNGGYTDTAISQIDENLASIGYPITKDDCPDRSDRGATNIPVKSGYSYCVYSYSGTSEDTASKTSPKGTYYGVLTYIRFNFPIIGGAIKIPLYGETRIIFQKGRIEG